MSLQVRDLCKDYPTRSGPLSVLRHLTFDLAPGESLAVMGPSGSGKSTLLYILGTLDRPTSGGVALAGQDPFALPEKQLADFRNRHIGFVFQDHYLLPQCSVLENVLIPTLVSREDRGQAEAWARQLLLELHREQATILIVVTHSAELARQFPRQMEMGDGTLQAPDGGAPTEIHSRPAGGV